MIFLFWLNLLLLMHGLLGLRLRLQVSFVLRLGLLLLLRRELLLVTFRLLRLGGLMLGLSFLLGLRLYLWANGRCRLLHRSRLRVMLTGELPLVCRGLSLHSTFAAIRNLLCWHCC